MNHIGCAVGVISVPVGQGVKGLLSIHNHITDNWSTSQVSGTMEGGPSTRPTQTTHCSVLKTGQDGGEGTSHKEVLGFRGDQHGLDMSTSQVYRTAEGDRMAEGKLP